MIRGIQKGSGVGGGGNKLYTGGAALPYANLAAAQAALGLGSSAFLTADQGATAGSVVQRDGTGSINANGFNGSALSVTGNVAGGSLAIAGALVDGTYPISNTLGGVIQIQNGVIINIVAAS